MIYPAVLTGQALMQIRLMLKDLFEAAFSFLTSPATEVLMLGDSQQ